MAIVILIMRIIWSFITPLYKGKHGENVIKSLKTALHKSPPKKKKKKNVERKVMCTGTCFQHTNLSQKFNSYSY